MKLSSLALPKPFLEKINIESLNPPQEAAIKKGLLDGKSLVVASPTASGKTLIAELATIKHFANEGKIVYTAPLKALASEKYEEFKKKYEDLGLRVAISVGDYDSAEDWLGRYDVIMVTNEKLDSLIRHNSQWIKSVTLLIVDEIHLLTDPGRGPTLEVVLTRLKKEINAQIIALSATISNSDELADWLDAELVKSDYRPIPLYPGVIYQTDVEEHEISFAKKKNQILIGKNSEETLILDTFNKHKQILTFLSSRRSAEATAERFAKVIFSYLSRDEKQQLATLSRDIEKALPNPTKQCLRLSKLIKSGAAFHHAGLIPKQRQLIEENFKSGLIKVITATPTLAYGVNLPAWRVLIRDLKRFDGGGMSFIPALEVQQMMGRAGRPAYDKEGEAILYAKTKDEAKDVWKRFVESGTEPIESKLAAEPMLRLHTLGLIATQAVKTKEDLFDFYSKTFFAYQYKDSDLLKFKLEKILTELEKWSFITIGDESFISRDFKPAFSIENPELKPTLLGKRISELYLDPLSAYKIIQELKPAHDLNYLMAIARCGELRPLLRTKQSEQDDLHEQLASSPLKDIPEVWDVDYEEYLDAFKTSMMLQSWMDEMGEDFILEKFTMPPGEVYNKIKSAEWLLYAGRELALLLNKKEIANRWNRLSLRVKHGVREDLLSLVKLKGIGRVRARMLWKNKIQSVSDIKKVDEKILAEILGPKIAQKIKEEAMVEK